MIDWQSWVGWLIHLGGIFAQAYVAYRAQSNPEWAWLNGAIGVAQATAPSPFSARAGKPDPQGAKP